MMLWGVLLACESTAPVWTTIPTVQLTAGGSTPLDLDTYVDDPDGTDELLVLTVEGGDTQSVLATLDATSHIVTLRSATGYTGNVGFTTKATDPDGNTSATQFSVNSTASGGACLDITTPQAGGSYVNGIQFKSRGNESVVKVRYSADGYTMGESSDPVNEFPLFYTFSQTGNRTIVADAFSASGAKLCSDSISLTVISSASTLAITEPVDGGSYDNGIWFKAMASSDITTVKWYADTWLLGESTDAGADFAVYYTFSNVGTRQINAQALNNSGQVVASDSITITIKNPEDPATGESGLGVWLWYIEGTGYTHTQLADKLATLGVKRIYIKVADGNDIWPEATNTSIPDTYQARGIEAWAWSYNYPGNDEIQANALYSAAKAGYDGYVLDLEIEFDGKTTSLHNLLGAFTDARSDVASDGYIDSATDWPMYTTTWGNPADHNMHVEIIDQYVDGHMPQTYLEVWGTSYMADPSYWVEVGTAEYRSLGAKKPIHHIVSSETDQITAAQINEFFATSGPESSIWRVPGGGTPTSIWNDWNQVDWSMFDSDGANISFVSPVEGGWYTNGVWFKVKADSLVKKIAYYADGYKLGESSDAAGNYPLKYTFTTLGTRTVVARGYDSTGKELGNKSVTFVVTDSSGGTGSVVVNNVPYFFQYDNTINPGGSCQNTSLAMVLKKYGVNITPDTISTTWGTSYAQDPYGLAEVFNYYAAKYGIPQRMKAHLDGTVSDVNALLQAGKPVIVHGYFTGYGHVLVLVGYDSSTYTANDPAGKWTQVFKGGYYPSDSDDGKYIKYNKDKVIQAINTLDGYTTYPIWYHEVR